MKQRGWSMAAQQLGHRSPPGALHGTRWAQIVTAREVCGEVQQLDVTMSCRHPGFVQQRACTAQLPLALKGTLQSSPRSLTARCVLTYLLRPVFCALPSTTSLFDSMHQSRSWTHFFSSAMTASVIESAS